jgi:predicted AlkP superfamily phosphohydrolase/phosphomutase
LIQVPNSSKSSLGLGILAYSGLLIGAYSGVVFSVLSFAMYGSVSAAFLFDARHAVHSYAYTIAIYSLFGGAVGVVFGILLWAASRALPFIRGKAIWILLVFPFAALMPFVFVNAKWQIEQPRNVALFDEYRIAFLQRSLLVSVAVGLALSLILVFALGRVHLLRRARGFHVGFLAFVLIICIGTLAQMHLTHGRISSVRVEDLTQHDASGAQVLLVGLDGVTWTVLQPLFAQGKLPHLKKFRDESAYGALQVYGKAYSPAVWTTMVTGVKRFRHGIMTHTVLGPEGIVRTGSGNRKVPALWNITSAAGLKAGLINYMASFPPEHITGFNFAGITPLGATPYERSIWPPELVPEVSRIIESVPPAEGVDDHAADLNREVDALTRLFVRFWDPSYSFFTLYTHSTDDIEHRYWNYMNPESFRGTVFEPTAEEVSEKGDAICDHFEKVDALFERIESAIGPNTSVIVVSDHGMEAATSPEVHLSLNDLLAKMGFLFFTKDGGIDYSRTLAYWPAGSEVNLRATGLTINRNAMPAFLDGARSFEEIRDHVIEKLRQVRLVGTGEPFFPAVYSTLY